MEKEVEKLIKAWEKLESGNHSPKVIAKWLLEDMKPEIDNLRKKIRISKPKKKINLFENYSFQSTTNKSTTNKKPTKIDRRESHKSIYKNTFCIECGEGYQNEEAWIDLTECALCGHPKS